MGQFPGDFLVIHQGISCQGISWVNGPGLSAREPRMEDDLGVDQHQEPRAKRHVFFFSGKATLGWVKGNRETDAADLCLRIMITTCMITSLYTMNL